MENTILLLVVMLLFTNGILIYYIKNLYKKNKIIYEKSEYYQDSLGRMTKLLYNLLFVKHFDRNHNTKIITEFFTASDLIKFKWSETEFNDESFFKGNDEDYPERDLGTPEKMAEWIEKFGENERNLESHRIEFFLKNIWRKIREFNPQLEIKSENYTTFRDNYISLIKGKS